MQLKNLFDDDRAVSPVIGVILMVAITVILAAVIGTFVLGLGDRVSTSTPSASFTFDYTQGDTTDELGIAHNGGDTLTGSNVNVTLSGTAINGSSDDVDGSYAWSTLDGGEGDINAGTSATVSNSTLEGASSTPSSITSLDLSAASASVTWSSSEGDSSAVLGSWSGPQA